MAPAAAIPQSAAESQSLRKDIEAQLETAVGQLDPARCEAWWKRLKARISIRDGGEVLGCSCVPRAFLSQSAERAVRPKMLRPLESTGH
jgi:hypothetical protein